MSTCVVLRLYLQREAAAQVNVALRCVFVSDVVLSVFLILLFLLSALINADL